MANLVPQLRVNFGNIGVDLFIRLPDLSSFENTFLSADEVSGQTTISVLKGTNFSANEYVLFKDGEQSEILLASASDATTITVPATAFAHARGTEVVFIPFNRIEIERSTDSGSSFSNVSTVDIRPDKEETPFNRPSDASTDQYRIRFSNVQDSTASAYSDAVVATGLAVNTIGSVKKRALANIGEKVSDFINTEFLNEALHSLRREVDKESRRWSFRMLFDQDLGDINEGTYSVAVPSTLRTPDTHENILNLRIGSDKRALRYIDRRKFWKWYEGIKHTTLNGSVSASATDITLTTSRDFEDDGSFVIEGVPVTAVLTGTIDPAASTTVTGVSTLFNTEVHVDDYLIVTGETRRVTEIASDTSLTVAAAFSNNANDTTPDVRHAHADTVDYTDNIVTANQVFGVTNVQHGGHATGAHVWQDHGFGTPTEYTIDNGVIYFNVPFSDDHIDENIWADFYSELTDQDSDADTFDEPNPDMFVYGLSWKIKLRKNPSMNLITDADYLEWTRQKGIFINLHSLGQNIRFIPSGFIDSD